MSEPSRGLGKDLCGRVHAVTGLECYLPDTHYPQPHQALFGGSWHDGLCTRCAGSGVQSEVQAGVRFEFLCAACNGTAFEPLTLPDTYQPG
ncbi:hypothetical protein [Kribbella sindirgiensis]|uniref:Uncharacterized protein n=1 Tax=Kribbella sindirgiensis TaxID=1124744 RepID=A0A4R0IM61_9ACTN|nr:hypothetical protein [Kribbella sindirgiensis]TCC33374.1 hypothetical protein E0H50_15415 [Kribbella sindirgiensis]